MKTDFDTALGGKKVGSVSGMEWKCWDCGDSGLGKDPLDASLRLYNHRQQEHVRRTK